MVSLEQLPQADRLILLIAGSFIILAGLKMAGGFIGPLLLSIFATIIFSMVSKWLQKRGIKPVLANYLSFALFILCLVGVMAITIYSITPLVSHLPTISEGITSNMNILQSTLSKSGIDLSSILPMSQMSGSLSAISPDMLTSVAGQITSLFIVLFTTLFLLLESSIFSRKISKTLGAHKQDLAEKVNEFGTLVIEYVIIRAKVNICTGAGFGIALFLLGVKDPILWGILMFVLNFVPYVGFIIALVPPTILAWVEVSPLTALLVIIVASMVNLISENILFPQLAGKGLQLSPAIVFISMIFWGFFLGGSGVLVAVPLTVLLKMVLESYPETEWLATIIGLEPEH